MTISPLTLFGIRKCSMLCQFYVSQNKNTVHIKIYKPCHSDHTPAYSYVSTLYVFSHMYIIMIIHVSFSQN